MAWLIGGETAVVEFLTGGDEVEDHAGEFVSRAVMALGAPNLALIRR